MALITVGLPVYNAEAFLRESMDSLLGQTFTDFVLIISDNASVDGTADICQDYVRRDDRVRYFRNAENIGLPGNFNRVFELSDTRYFKWSSADDYWGDTMLEKSLAVLEADPEIALCYPKTTFVDAAGGNPQPYEDKLCLTDDDPKKRFIQLHERVGLCHHLLGLIRTEHLRKTMLYGPHNASDIALLAELSLYGKFFELPERLYFRRFHEKSSSWARGDEEHQRRQYHASGTANIKLDSWRHYLRLMRVVARSELSGGDKVSLLSYVLRSMRWDRKNLVREIWSLRTPQ